jgi:hypothetical protein
MLIIFFITVIFAVPVLTKLEVPKEISVSENRALAKPPVLTVENVLDGKYFSGWETYLSDHIWLRDGWLFADTVFELSEGHSVVRDVVITPTALLPYVASDAPDEYADASATAMAAKYKALSDAALQNGGVFLYINVPEQCSMLRDLYPAGLYTGELRYDSQNRAFESAMVTDGVNYLDMRPIFEATGNAAEFYSQTDHHYNLKGAYLTYQTLCDSLSSLGVGVTAKTDAVLNTLPNTFKGSRGRKIYNLTSFNDKLMYITWDSPIAFTRSDNGNTGVAQVYVLPSSDSEDVAYNMYMGGDIAETVIETGRPNLPDALIFGDSFTNALETVLYTSFDTTVSLDFRYNTKQSIYDYIKQYKPDVVICLRDDTATLSTDGNGNLPG